MYSKIDKYNFKMSYIHYLFYYIFPNTKHEVSSLDKRIRLLNFQYNLFKLY